MTALNEVSNKVAGFRAGAVDYITKPLDAAELLARVQTHLSLRKLQMCNGQRLVEIKTTTND